MINYTNSGETVSAVAPYAVASGGGALLNKLFGVAVKDYAQDEEGEFVTKGCFNLPAVSADTASAYALAYWNNSTKLVTTTATGNTLIGCFTAAKINGATTVNIRLNGVAAAVS